MSQHHAITTLRHLVIAASAVLLAVPAASVPAAPLDWLIGSTSVAGNGTVSQQTRALGHFDAIALGMGGSVEVSIGNTESVTVSTDDNLQALVETFVEDGTLKIRSKKGYRLNPTKLRLVVQARGVRQLTVGGSGTITAAGLRSATLDAEVGGSGSINLPRLDSDTLRVQIGGSGNFSASGRAGQLRAAIGGSGNVDAAQLAADAVQVSIGGSGQAAVWAKRELGVSVAGSGDVEYYGDPQQFSKSIAGSGRVKRLGAAPR